VALIARLDDRPRAVALRALGLGDTLTAVPALRALARALPALRVTVAMPAPLAPLLALAQVPCDVLPCAGFDDAAPAGQRVAVAVNLHGSGPQSHRWLAQLRPERWVAFHNPAVAVEGPGWDDDEHERVRWCRLVSATLGVRADPDDVRFPTVRHRAGPVTDGYALVHPGAASGARRWPAERFAEVARWLVGRGLRVVVTGGTAEQRLVDEVVRRAARGERVLPAGPTDLRQLAGLVAGARALVCGDTGVAHVASATGTPSVLLFGPTSPRSWGPPTTGPHRVLWHGSVGDPHAATVDAGLLRITVDEAIEALDELLPAAGGLSGLSPAGRAPSGWRGGTSGRQSASAAASTGAPRPGSP
jgi:ADP-heptose:LPS heptosyltransferase